MCAFRFKSCVPFLHRVLYECKRNALFSKVNYATLVNAGIVIIGDEILKGLSDINTPFLIKNLTSMNVNIKRVTIIPDEVDAIASEIRELSSKCSFVITAGGIGPTHDDVTYEAIAKACNESLILNQDIFKLVASYFGPESRNNPAILKYCQVPSSSVVNYVDIDHNNKVIRYPIVSVRNIFIFPGVPILLQKSFEALKSKFFMNNINIFTKDLFINADEFSITVILNEAVEKYKELVKFGSYPIFNNNYYKVKLVLESQHKNVIEEAGDFLSKQLPKNSVVNFKVNNFLSKEQIYSHCKSMKFMSAAVTVFEKTVQKYSLSELCVCFNGGKDCTALLHLLYSCVQYLKPEEWKRINFLYIRNGEPFNEVETFIRTCADFYHFDLITVEGDLKHSITKFLQKNPVIKVMLLGTRRSDPGAANLEHFCSTDSDWPPIVRVLPILDWSYSDVWHYLRTLQIPYCILYDQGFTSLGDKTKTRKNPSLLRDEKSQIFKPAYMLNNPETERKSRL